jgi:hypothetical protein
MRLIPVLLLLAAGLFAPMPSASAADAVPPPATVYKDPSCGCCGAYVEYLRRNGFAVSVVETPDLAAVKEKEGVPASLGGCHTMTVGGYVVEGHVPVAALRRLLAEKPAIRGISLPGMPEGSPGMGGTKQAPFTIYAITAAGGPPPVYATE